ncbi:hypothetical protein VKT23_010725 [Stygiomarasmius scandens]|uniref:Uncharacterized protein n=1 Tax=Marasmiellus scandens TaxID=2682957 RepID=A0ABR1JBX7_9AGAR
MQEDARVGHKELFKYLDQGQGTRKQKEDKALGMLLRRFRLEDRMTWQTALQKKDGLGDSSSFSQELRSSMRLNSTDKRIVQVHNALSKAGEDALCKMVEHIMSTCALVTFAIDYNAFTTGKGGRKRKMLIAESMFQSDIRYRHWFEGMSDLQSADKMTELLEEFREFRKELESITQARNRLLKVYDTLGMGIFLDPFWNIGNLARTRRTPEFARILAELPEHIPNDRYDPSLSGLTEDQENTFHIVVWILAEKVPSFVPVFVKSVNCYPCDIIRHRDGLQEGEVGYLEPLEYEYEGTDSENSSAE